jgi:hypothetical protein
MPEPYFVLNRNEGQDTVHRDPREECNVDDVEGRQVIDEATAVALADRGDARRCAHCYLED